MAKIMLVEDDNNLREIYGARLLAEGYQIVSAEDGEKALALAVKEKPDLIVADIMMPKISGFDMLDILRTTPEIKNTKVIMMTALGQTEDKDHATKLGADRYLVKSQVTLEDVARVVREVLADQNPGGTLTPRPTAAPAQPVMTPVVQASVPAAPAPSSMPVVSSPAPTATPTLSPSLSVPASSEEATVSSQIKSFIDNTATNPTTPTPAPSSGSTSIPVVIAPPDNTSPVAPAPSSNPAFTDNPKDSHISPDPVVVAPDPNANTDDATPADSSTVVVPPAPPEPVGEKAASAINNDAVLQGANTLANPSKNGELANKASEPPHKKIIQPLDDLTMKGPDLAALLAKEDEKVPVVPPAVDSVIPPAGSTTPAPGTKREDTSNEPGRVYLPSEKPAASNAASLGDDKDNDNKTSPSGVAF